MVRKKQRKYVIVVLMLSLMISTNGLTGLKASWAGDIPLELCWNEETDGKYYMVCNDEGRNLIDLRLIQADELELALEKEVDKSSTQRIFWFGIGILLGGIAGVVIAK